MSRAAQPEPAAPRLLSVVLHDVAPATWERCERVIECVRAVGPLPITLLAVPRYHHQPQDPAFERWLDAARRAGDELALHGYTHSDDSVPRGWFDHVKRRWYTAGEGEFAALSRHEAGVRLRAGMRWFRHHGWPLRGFVAPAWLLSRGTWEALDELRFDYTCTLGSVVTLPERRVLRSQSIVYSTRAAWRRALSLPWNAAVARSQRHRPLLRFELHPGDAEHASIRASWMGLLEQAVTQRRALTLAAAVREAQAGR